MDRAQKAESIETLKGVFADAGAVVVTHNLGLTVADMEDLRGRLRKEGGTFKVVKNRLALKALEAEEGSDYHGLFKGPVGIAYAPDAVTAAKVTAEFAKGNDKFVVQGGFMGDKHVTNYRRASFAAWSKDPVEQQHVIDNYRSALVFQGSLPVEY